MTSTANDTLSDQTETVEENLQSATPHVTEKGDQWSDNPNQAAITNELLPPGCYIYQCSDTTYTITTIPDVGNSPPKPDTVLKCDIEGCNKEFTNVKSQQLHDLLHKEKRYNCPYEGCDYKFRWPAHLKYHSLKHLGQRPYVCKEEGCGKAFYTNQRLAVHKRLHSGDKPYACRHSGCNKAFTTAGNLKNHQRIHSGEKPFMCDVAGCGKRFAEHSSLRKHKLVHSGQKPFQCDICGQPFTQSGSRNVHVRKHHMTNPTWNIGSIQASTSTTTSSVSGIPENFLQSADLPMGALIIVPAESGHEFQYPDQVVTVSTQPLPADYEQSLGLNSDFSTDSQEVSTENTPINSDASLASTTANVVVLSQPQEIVSITTDYHDNQETREEIVYESDLLQTDFDHEETASLASSS